MDEPKVFDLGVDGPNDGSLPVFERLFQTYFLIAIKNGATSIRVEVERAAIWERSEMRGSEMCFIAYCPEGQTPDVVTTERMKYYFNYVDERISEVIFGIGVAASKPRGWIASRLGRPPAEKVVDKVDPPWERCFLVRLGDGSSEVVATASQIETSWLLAMSLSGSTISPDAATERMKAMYDRIETRRPRRSYDYGPRRQDR
jgi:hypothetical protein